MLPAYADENVDHRIVAGLLRRQMNVVTAQERDQKQTDDEILLATATSESRLMLTNDADFLRLHSEWLAAGKSHGGIIFWTVDVPIGDVIREIIKIAETTSEQDATNLLRFV